MGVDKDYNFFTENLENTLSTSCCILSLGVINTRFCLSTTRYKLYKHSVDNVQS